MSTFENILWHILGYGAIPLIFIAGFVGVAIGSLWVLSLTADKDSE